MNLKGNAAPEARGAKPFQHSNIYYDTFFSQNAAVAIFQKGLSQKCGNSFIKCGQSFENVGNVGPLGTLSLPTYIPTYIHTYMHKAYIHTYIHTYIYTYIHTHTCMHNAYR